MGNNLERMRYCIEDELGKIAEKGLSTGNVDIAYKLIDMMKDIKNVDYWDATETAMSDYEYSRSNGDYPRTNAYERDNSYRHRDARGRYTRDNGNSFYNAYMDTKREYRTSQSADCKARMMASLQDCLDDFTNKLEDMYRDADCAEARAEIMRYVNKLKAMM